jgi:SAM-dependent methyltransferase
VTDEQFVEDLYRLLLRRSPDAEARDRAVGALADGTLSRATLATELTGSEEFARIRTLDDAVARARHARAIDERPRNLTAPPGDERPIEIAWTLARYRGEPRVLDVGCANAEPVYLAGLVAAVPGRPTGLDLADAEVPGMDTVQGDLRKLPFERGSFDVVFSISTLEHVGKDNRVYGLAAERDSAAIPAALRELKRVLSRGGRVLLTVPTGDNEDREWFVQRDPRSWRDLFLRAGFGVYEQEVYELGDEGWRSTETLAPGARYGARGPGASAVLCVELRPGRLRHALRHSGARLRRRMEGGRATPDRPSYPEVSSERQE